MLRYAPFTLLNLSMEHDPEIGFSANYVTAIMIPNGSEGVSSTKTEMSSRCGDQEGHPSQHTWLNIDVLLVEPLLIYAQGGNAVLEGMYLISVLLQVLRSRGHLPRQVGSLILKGIGHGDKVIYNRLSIQVLSISKNSPAKWGINIKQVLLIL